MNKVHLKYEAAFKDIKQTASGWIAETLYDNDAKVDEVKLALSYLVAMIDTYDTAIREWSDNE